MISTRKTLMAITASIMACTARANPPVSSVYGDALQRQTMTFALRGDAEMRSYSSQAADSKESKVASTLTLSMWTGESRNLGMSASSTVNTVPFSLNGAETKHDFREIRLTGRLGPFYASAIGAISEIAVNKAEGKFCDISGMGVGGGAGFAMPLHANILAYGDASAIQTSGAYDRVGHKAAMGPRIDGEVGAAVDVTPQLLDVIVGYKLRTFSMKIDDTEYKEGSQGAFAGLRLGAYF